MKKAFAITSVILGLLFTLTACGNTGNNETTNQPSSQMPNSTPSSAPTTDPSNTPINTPEATLSGVVKTGGSTSVEKVMNALIFQFQEDNQAVTVNYEMNGSGDGIKNTLSDLYEIGHSSRELKTDGSEDALDATAYAIDGIAVIVHKKNGVLNLTKEQILGIYTGNITNWKDVGGKDAPITVVTRESGSGTRSAFAEIIGLEKKKDGNPDPATAIVTSANEQNSTGAVQTTVSQNENAIGYMSFSDFDSAKVNSVNYEGIAISDDTLKDGTYKLKREFWLVTKQGATLSAAAQAFIDYVMSADGQAIVAENKLLPVK